MTNIAAPAPVGATLKSALEAQLERLARLVKIGSRATGTLTMQQGHVPWLLRELGDVPLEQLTARVLDELAARSIDRALESGRSVKTIQKKFSTLRQALELAVRHEQLERLPLFPTWEFPPIGAPKHRWCKTWDEVGAILAALPRERAAWLALCVWTGQHAADVDRATWADVRLDQGEIFLRCTKNRKPGLWVKCPRPLLAILRARHAQLRPGADARIVKPWPTRFYQLGRVCLKLGVPPITATGLRHTAATFVAAELGISVAAMKWFGWSSYAMQEQVYAHALRGQLDQVADVLSPRRPPVRAAAPKGSASAGGKQQQGRKAA